MSIKIACDKCEDSIKLHEHYSIVGYPYNTGMDELRIELCKDCAAALLKKIMIFLANKEGKK